MRRRRTRRFLAGAAPGAGGAGAGAWFNQGDLLASLTIHASSCARQRLTALIERSQRLGWGYFFCAQCTVHVQVRAGRRGRRQQDQLGQCCQMVFVKMRKKIVKMRKKCASLKCQNFYCIFGRFRGGTKINLQKYF